MEKSLIKKIRDAHYQHQTISTVVLCETYMDEGYTPTVWVLIMYARSLTGIGRFADAVVALDQAESKGADFWLPIVLTERGRIEERQGNLERAKTYWLQANKLAPDDAGYLILAASAAFKQGDLSEAERLTRLATKCTEGSPEEAWYNLGGYLVAQERYAEALQCYDRAIAIDPEYESALKRREEILSVLPDLSG